MTGTKEKLLTFRSVQTYLAALGKRFSGEPLPDNQKELIKEINILLEYNPHLEEELLNTYLAPVTSTYSGMKMIFSEEKGNQKDKKPKEESPPEYYSASEWKSMRKAAASRSKLFNTLRDKIDQLQMELIEKGKDTRKFFIHMPLGEEVMLHLEVVRMGTQWLVIPTASCPIIYKRDEGDEIMQTKFKSLRMNVSEFKHKGVFVEQGKIIIKSTGNDQ
ncbi:MAG: hypothetical protein PVH61_30015 [Candidatus Aminicenantes bacterium]|jgi:hypothetical protein